MTTPTPNDVAAAAAAAQGGTGGTPPAGGQQPPSGQGSGGTTGMITQEHMNHLLAEQKRELQNRFGDYDTVKEKAGRFDALIATTQSAEEQAAELNARLATRDRDYSDAQLTIQRQSLAGASGLPHDLWDMVGGTDETSIKSNIEKLKRHLGNGQPDPAAQGSGQQPEPTRQRPQPVPGQGTPPPQGSKGAGTMQSGRDLYQSRSKKSSAQAPAST